MRWGVLSGILLFCLSYGPSALLWGAILFLPGRYLWRRGSPSMTVETPAL